MSFGSEFLTCPELFPARRSGEPWGDHRVTIDFLGGPYLFSGLHRSQVEAVRNHFRPYQLQEDASPYGSVEIRFYRAGESDFRKFRLKGWEYHLDLDCRSHSVRVAGLEFMGLLEWRPDLAGAVWTSALDPDRFCEVFENFLRATAQYHLLESGGLLVHSAALVIDDAAYLFPGRSGAGKSTLSRLATAHHWQVLSDELNALSVQEETTYIQQVPFAGDFGRARRSNRSFPLTGIFRLKQAEADAVEPLPISQALGVMLSCSPFVNLDPYRRGHAQSVLEGIVSQQPIYTLNFSLAGELAALDRFASQARVSTV